MPIPASIAERVETFRRNLDSYLAADYKETELRREFLDPLFEALGWDVSNRQGHAEAYKDVVHEDMLKIHGQSTAPDYSFRIGGNRKFFVEAKKPAVRIKDDPAPAAQLRRYSWTAKLPLGIATDFQEFAIYDTRVRPRADDKASTGRIFYCTFEELAARWDEIAAIFSKDAVLKGSFDKYAATNRGKRGTAEFDADFLADLENWRQLLAVNLAKRNTLDERELNFAVQRILDRIVFLRIAEDRGIEPLGQLQSLTAGPRVYPRLREIFERADFRYNSGLFHFATERGRDEAPDRLTLGLELDDAVLKEILSALYWPKSPYAFAVVSADILGNVYEQFLGKVIQLDGAHRVRVNEKPEVRKAGGVYYTPTYIVDYIVRQTVGPLVAGKTPKQIEKLRVLDPACGSGSFLLGAYEFLLAWHLDYYAKNEPAAWAKKKNPPIYETSPNAHGVGRGDGGWRLTTAERKRILVAHVHGVDIDAQAVEVTKLSLLLKVLEGEARELQGKQLEFHRVLPDLGNNIKCGNSLIGPDFFQQPDLPELDDDARYKINAFDWAAEFRPIMDAGGFDAVIGNPPWLMAGYHLEPEMLYLKSRYASATGKFDLYYLFLEKAFQLAGSVGRVGMITPNKFFHTKAAAALRDILLAKTNIERLVDFGDAQLFKGATNYSTITITSRAARSTLNYSKVREDFSKIEEVEIAAASLPRDGAPWNFGRSDFQALFDKIAKRSVPLRSLARRFGTGLQTGADKVYTFKPDESPEVERDLLRPILRGRDVRRYAVGSEPKRVLFPYEESAERFTILSEAALQRKPKAFAYLRANRAKLDGRIWFDQTAEQLSGAWFGFVYLDSKTSFSAPHILTPALSSRANFALGDGTLFVTGTAGVTSIIPSQDTQENILFLLGLLNSTLLQFFVVRHSPVFSGGFYKFSAPYLKKIPIRRIDFAKKPDRARHDQLVALVERMLKLHADLPAAKSPDAQTRLQREIKATDAAIDQLVYQLYELTPEEIALVEAATAPAAKPGATEDLAGAA